MRSEKNKNRIFYLDFLRVLAIVAVVIIHVVEQNWWLLPVGSSEHVVLTIFDGMARFAVPVFVMISGALMLGRDLTFRKLLGKVGRLAAVWVIWCVIYAVMALISGKGQEVALNELMFGHFHMWFIGMIAVLYLMTPIFREIAKRPKWCFLAILALLIFSAVAKFRWTAYPMFYLLGYALSKGGQMFDDVLAKSKSLAKVKRNTKSIRFDKKTGVIMLMIYGLLFLMSTIAIVGLNLKASFVDGTAIRPADADWSIFTAVQAMAVFMVVKMVALKRQISEAKQEIYSRLAQDVFGVYLVHIAVLGVLNRLRVSNLMFVKFADAANLGGTGVVRELIMVVAATAGLALTAALVTAISFGLVEIYHRVLSRATTTKK